MAKTAKNSRGKSGKGKSARGGRSVASRDGRSRGKAQQRQPQKARGSKQPVERRGGFMKFLRDVRIELSKVTWPTRKDLIQSTIVVLVAVAIAAAYTFALDEIFTQVVNRIVNLLT